MALRVFAVVAVAVGGQRAMASGARDGLCPSTGYQSIGWPGMSKDKCVARAEEVHRDGAGCSLLSYSSSSGPQSSSNFCRCFSSCGGDLIHPAGEQWETLEIGSATNHLTSSPSPAPAPPARSSASDGDVRTGICQGSGYMNIAWGGMSREQCLDRAYQVLKDTSRCGHVSYSPSLTSNFCRCFASCEGELRQPEGEQWETTVPQQEQKSLDLAVLICIVAGIAACLVATGCAGAFVFLRCRSRSVNDRRSLADVPSESSGNGNGGQQDAAPAAEV